MQKKVQLEFTSLKQGGGDAFGNNHSFHKKSIKYTRERDLSDESKNGKFFFKFQAEKTKTRKNQFVKQQAKKVAPKQCQVQRSIKFKIYERITNPTDKNLFPILMGPHPIYTIEMERDNKLNSVDLRQKLTRWMKAYWKLKILQINKNKNSQKKNLSEEVKNQKQKKESQDNNCRVGLKYNKYSLEFKKDIVKRIHMKLEEDAPNQKSLRYYISQQAQRLRIHPKNIIRWFDTQDLDRREGGRKAKHPILEYRLARFVRENSNCKRRQIIMEAKNILKQLGGDANFTFSKGWYERFKNRVKGDKVSRSMESILYDKLNSTKRKRKNEGTPNIIEKDEDEIFEQEEEIDQQNNHGEEQCKMEEQHVKMEEVWMEAN